jgi:hypothetical protein
VLVCVEDPDDEPVEPEQHDDREQHLAEADGEIVERRGRLVAGEQRHQHGRQRDERERQRSQRDQQQPGERARELQRLAPSLLLQQLAEHRHERGRERGVGDQRPDQVRHLERQRERRHRAGRAEVAARDDLAREPRHAREAGEDGEDDRVARAPGGAAPRRRAAGRGGGGRGQDRIAGERLRAGPVVDGRAGFGCGRCLAALVRCGPRETLLGCGVAGARGAPSFALRPGRFAFLVGPLRRRIAARPSHSGAL